MPRSRLPRQRPCRSDRHRLPDRSGFSCRYFRARCRFTMCRRDRPGRVEHRTLGFVGERKIPSWEKAHGTVKTGATAAHAASCSRPTRTKPPKMRRKFKGKGCRKEKAAGTVFAVDNIPGDGTVLVSRYSLCTRVSNCSCAWSVKYCWSRKGRYYFMPSSRVERALPSEAMVAQSTVDPLRLRRIRCPSLDGMGKRLKMHRVRL